MKSKSLTPKLLSSIILLTVSINAISQLTSIRSLQKRLPEIKDSSCYVDALNKLGMFFYQKSWDSCYYYGTEAYNIANRTHYRNGIAGALNVLGTYYFSSNSFLATKYYNESLHLYRELKDTGNIAQIYNNLAMISFTENDYSSCRKLLMQADSISRGLRKDSIRSLILFNIAIRDTSLSAPVRDSLLKASIAISRKYKDSLIGGFTNTLLMLLGQADGKKVVEQLKEQLPALEAEENNYRLYDLYTMIATLLNQQGNKQEALPYFQKALGKAKNNKNHFLIITAMSDLAGFYASLGDYKSAFNYAQQVSSEKEKQQELMKKSGYTYMNYVTHEKDLQLAQQQSAAKTQIIIISSILLLISLISIVAIFILLERARYSEKTQLQLSQALYDQNTQLRSWNKFNDMLLSVLAHDIRQPFVTIISFATAMEEDNTLSEQEIKSIVKELHEISAQGLHFMDGLLSWIKSRRDDFAYKPQSILVKESLVNANYFFTIEQNKKSIQIEINIAPGISVMADNIMLQFILRNLLSNATKYSPSQGVIGINATVREKSISIDITDQGPGISDEAAATLFSVKNSGNAFPGGAGLALIICNEMAHLMNGAVTVNSTPGRGSTFSLLLPKE